MDYCSLFNFSLNNPTESNFLTPFFFLLSICYNVFSIPQALGVFGLCQLHSFVDYVRGRLTTEDFDTLFRAMLVGTGGIVAASAGILTLTGKFQCQVGRKTRGRRQRSLVESYYHNMVNYVIL